MAYPDKINALVDVSADETLAAGGHAARHNDVNEALEEVRDALGGGTPITATDAVGLELQRENTIEIRATRYTTGAQSPTIALHKGRGSIASPTTVADNDNLGQLMWRGYSSAAGDFVNAAAIRCDVDADPDTSGDASDMPGRLEFLVTANGAGDFSERMRINNAGAVLIGTTTPGSAGAGDLVVNGGVFLGGTAAGNELDDYEEGTWTPVAVGWSFGNGTINTATYVKVGKMVALTFDFTCGSTTSDGSPNFIFGIPFGLADKGYALARSYNSGGSVDYMLPIYLRSDGNVLIRRSIASDLETRNWDFSNPYSFGTGDTIQFNIVYECD